MLTALFLITAAVVTAAMIMWVPDLLKKRRASKKKSYISPVDTSEWKYGDILKLDTDYRMDTAYFVVAIDGNKVIVRSANTYDYFSSTPTKRDKILAVIAGKVPFDEKIEALFDDNESCHKAEHFINLSLRKRKQAAVIAAIKEKFQERMEIQQIVDQELQNLNNEEVY